MHEMMIIEANNHEISVQGPIGSDDTVGVRVDNGKMIVLGLSDLSQFVNYVKSWDA